MARELNFSSCLMLQLIRDIQHMMAYRQSVGHCLTPNPKMICQECAKQLLHWHITNNHENILFIDEIFTEEEKYNKQNHRYMPEVLKRPRKVFPETKKGTTLLQ